MNNKQKVLDLVLKKLPHNFRQFFICHAHSGNMEQMIIKSKSNQKCQPGSIIPTFTGFTGFPFTSFSISILVYPNKHLSIPLDPKTNQLNMLLTGG